MRNAALRHLESVQLNKVLLYKSFTWKWILAIESTLTGHLAGSVGTECDSWFRHAEFKPRVGCGTYSIFLNRRTWFKTKPSLIGKTLLQWNCPTDGVKRRSTNWCPWVTTNTRARHLRELWISEPWLAHIRIAPKTPAAQYTRWDSPLCGREQAQEDEAESPPVTSSMRPRGGERSPAGPGGVGCQAGGLRARLRGRPLGAGGHPRPAAGKTTGPSTLQPQELNSASMSHGWDRSPSRDAAPRARAEDPAELHSGSCRRKAGTPTPVALSWICGTLLGGTAPPEIDGAWN